MVQGEKFRADLHYYGPIGFTPYWLKKQGYRHKNLLKLISDVCFERKINICAIISKPEETDKEGIIKRETWDDSVGYLRTRYLDDLNKIKGYKGGEFGPNSLIIEKNGKRVYLISGINLKIKEDDDREYDHLVIGSNAVPNFKNMRETLKFCNESGLLHGLENRACQAHFRLEEEEAKRYADECDFVEGYNSQQRWGGLAVRIPIIKVRDYAKISNKIAKALAKKYNKPYIATSGGQMIEDAGISHIEFFKGGIDESLEEKLIQSLQHIIRTGQFDTVEKYENPIDSLEWTHKSRVGHKSVHSRNGAYDLCCIN